MLNSVLRESLGVVLVVVKALILAILMVYMFGFPVRPAY
jgi:hypothetical protein